MNNEDIISKIQDILYSEYEIIGVQTKKKTVLGLSHDDTAYIIPDYDEFKKVLFKIIERQTILDSDDGEYYVANEEDILNSLYNTCITSISKIIPINIVVTPNKMYDILKNYSDDDTCIIAVIDSTSLIINKYILTNHSRKYSSAIFEEYYYNYDFDMDAMNKLSTTDLARGVKRNILNKSNKISQVIPTPMYIRGKIFDNIFSKDNDKTNIKIESFSEYLSDIYKAFL